MEGSTDTTIDTETASSTDSGSSSGKDALRALEDGVSTFGSRTWEFFHDLPGHGALLGGAVGLGAATLFGVAELAAAGLSAYVTYRVFAYGESWMEALENTIKFEKGALPMEEIKKPVVE